MPDTKPTTNKRELMDGLIEFINTPYFGSFIQDVIKIAPHNLSCMCELHAQAAKTLVFEKVAKANLAKSRLHEVVTYFLQQWNLPVRIALREHMFGDAWTDPYYTYIIDVVGRYNPAFPTEEHTPCHHRVYISKNDIVVQSQCHVKDMLSLAHCSTHIYVPTKYVKEQDAHFNNDCPEWPIFSVDNEYIYEPDKSKPMPKINVINNNLIMAIDGMAHYRQVIKVATGYLKPTNVMLPAAAVGFLLTPELRKPYTLQFELKENHE